jgi:hypothetical protein
MVPIQYSVPIVTDRLMFLSSDYSRSKIQMGSMLCYANEAFSLFSSSCAPLTKSDTLQFALADSLDVTPAWPLNYLNTIVRAIG